VIYPNYNFYTGQSFSEIKDILGDKVYEPDNDGGRKYCSYLVFNDTTTNSKVRIHSLLTFYKKRLVSYYSQFKTKDSTYNLVDWLEGQYSKVTKNNEYRSFRKDGKLQYKLQKDNCFVHLVIDEKYSDFSFSTYLVGDYRYKEIDWDNN
jgi:hypothetical protein